MLQCSTESQTLFQCLPQDVTMQLRHKMAVECFYWGHFLPSLWERMKAKRTRVIPLCHTGQLEKHSYILLALAQTTNTLRGESLLALSHFSPCVCSLTELCEVSGVLAEHVRYPQRWERFCQIHVGLSSKPRAINANVKTKLRSRLGAVRAGCTCESHLGMNRQTFLLCISLAQLCTVAVLMCGMTWDRGVFSRGITISMLMVSPW